MYSYRNDSISVISIEFQRLINFNMTVYKPYADAALRKKFNLLTKLK